MRRVVTLAAALAWTGLACAGPVREPIVERDDLIVALRSEPGAPRGYAHPLTVAPVRLRHILARLDARVGSGAERRRLPALADPLLQPVAEALAQALAEAGPEQEIVVQAIEKTRRFGLFDDQRFTGFLVWAEGNELVFQFTHVDWAVPKQGPDAKQIPDPKRQEAGKRVRLVPGAAMKRHGQGGVAVAWRDPLFREPPGPRRQILLEDSD